MSRNLTEFEDLLDLYGSRFERWPEEERGFAEALIGQSLDARRLYRQAQRFDAMLDDQSIEIDPADLGRLAAAIRSESLSTRQIRMTERFALRLTSWLPEFGWPQIATLAAAASVGILIGWTAAPSLADNSPAATNSTVASLLVQDGLLTANNQ